MYKIEDIICPECGQPMPIAEGTTCDVCDRGLMHDHHFAHIACGHNDFPWENICLVCWQKYLITHPNAWKTIPNYAVLLDTTPDFRV